MNSTKRLTTLAMLAALSLLVMFLIRFPLFLPFLTYEPKDVIIIIGGFLYGPLAAMLIIVVTSLIEMITISETGLWGLAMNIISSSALVIPAVLIYGRWRSLPGAVIGLIVGVISVVGVMLLWNYLIIPLYTPAVSRADVMPMLRPIILPFNLIKGGLNASVAMMLYKPVSMALTRAGLYKPAGDGASGKLNIWVVIISAFVVLSFVLVILVERGVL